MVYTIRRKGENDVKSAFGQGDRALSRRTCETADREYFPQKYTTTEMRNVIENLLSDWKRRQGEEEV